MNYIGTNLQYLTILVKIIWFTTPTLLVFWTVREVTISIFRFALQRDTYGNSIADQVQISVDSYNNDASYNWNRESVSFTLDKSSTGGFDQYIAEFALGAATGDATATIYGSGEYSSHVAGEDAYDLQLNYVLYDNPDGGVSVGGGSSVESLGIAGASAMGIGGTSKFRDKSGIWSD